MNDHRRIVRCPYCELRQFETHDRNCRRCRKALYWEWPASAPVPLEPEPRSQPAGWGKMLQQLRQERGFSQKQLAMKSKVVRTFISKLEARLSPPTMATAIRVAEALDIPNYVLANTELGYAYYCTHYLFADPLVKKLSQYLTKLSSEQRRIIVDTVQSLSEHHQISFTEWEQIAPTALEIKQCRTTTT